MLYYPLARTRPFCLLGPSSLATVSRVVADLVYMSTSRLFTPISSGTAREASFSFLSSASAEVFANVVLYPYELVKIRVQAQPHFVKSLLDGFHKLYSFEGFFGFYRGLVPLWGGNLPCNYNNLLTDITFSFSMMFRELRNCYLLLLSNKVVHLD